MFEGWLSYAGVELVNNARTSVYSRSLGIGALGCYDCCDSLAGFLGDQSYQDVCADPAPWYDPAVAASGRFGGFYGLEVTGTGRSTAKRTPAELITEGSVIGSARHTAREVTFSLLAAARDDAALSYGLSWLATMLDGAPCTPCGGGDDACMLAYCPCTDGDPTAQPLRNLFHVGLLEMDEAHSFSRLSSGAMIARTSFTLVAGIPHLFWPPIQLHSPALQLAAGPHGVIRRAAPRQHPGTRLASDVCIPEGQCLQDPTCPSPPPPAPPPAAADDCDCAQLPTLTVTVVFTGTGNTAGSSVDAQVSVSSGDPRVVRVAVTGSPSGAHDLVTGTSAEQVWAGVPAGDLQAVITDLRTGLAGHVVIARTGGQVIPAPQAKTLTVAADLAPISLTATVTLTGAHQLVATVTAADAQPGRLVQIVGGAAGPTSVVVNTGQAVLSPVLTPADLPYPLSLTFVDVASGEAAALAPVVTAPGGIWQVAPAQISWTVPYWFTQAVSLPAALLPDSAQRVLVIDISTGTLAMRCLQVDWYANPGDLPCEEVIGDACTTCATFQIGFVPAGARLQIDGRTRTAVVDCPGAGGLADATASMRTPDGTPYDWPVLDCASSMCVRVSAAQRAPDALIQIFAAAREAAA